LGGGYAAPEALLFRLVWPVKPATPGEKMFLGGHSPSKPPIENADCVSRVL
jgi:hypothetical protein